MLDLKRIAETVQAVATRWTALAVAIDPIIDVGCQHAAIVRAILGTTIAVLGADGPLNLAESVLLAQIFGSDLLVEQAEHRSTMGADLLGESLPALIAVAESFAEQPDYRADADPLLTVLSDILDVGLAADNVPSEAEAWAASRVLGKLRRAARGKSQHTLTSVTVESLVSQKDVAQTTVVAVVPRTDPARVASASTDLVRELLRELDNLVGLESVKEEVEMLINLARVRAMREERGLPSPDISFHLVFSGNPGTGKTTVARILGQIYGALGMLSVGKCMEVDRSALIGGYLGQTTTKTAAVLDGAQGSVLFIDEAYSLTAGSASGDTYGAEAIWVLIKFMEDHRDTFVLIAAGYSQEMETFLDSNPGLRSRFARTIHFPDYSADELMEILIRISASDGYRLDDTALPAVQAELEGLLSAKSPRFANGREVRKIYERAIGQQANRIGTERSATMTFACYSLRILDSAGSTSRGLARQRQPFRYITRLLRLAL